MHNHCVAAGSPMLFVDVEALLNCPPSTRIPWIPSPAGIDVGNPWDVYPAPESHCCDNVDPNTPFNAQGTSMSVTINTFYR